MFSKLSLPSAVMKELFIPSKTSTASENEIQFIKSLYCGPIVTE